MNIMQAERAADLSGWGELAIDKTFYLNPRWLAYVDSDARGRGTYWGAYADGSLVAGVSSHNPLSLMSKAYNFSALFDVDTSHYSAPAILGGRQGYLSGFIRNQRFPAHVVESALAKLLRAIEAANPECGCWWPFLLFEDAESVLSASLLDGGIPQPHTRLARADCVIDLAGSSVEDHVEALPTANRRSHYRREAARFDRSPLRIKELRLSESWRDLAPLLANVQRKYGDHSPTEVYAASLARQAAMLDEDAVVFGCFLADRLVGFSLFYKTAGELSFRGVGFDYDALPGVGEYARLAVHAPLDFCYQRGIPRLNLGVSSYEAKVRRGARIRPLWSLLPPRAEHIPQAADLADARLGSMATSEAVRIEQTVRDQWRRLSMSTVDA
ncbi:GNAT family N-acetyltransferase [Micromonospora foliorum]|uniref:GNAT family N-acetyltransferase n=1 Tax=Micromonospora foliorum TaxID=2911210 RepID=UPI001EE7ECC2|nr:GNAT family N-acetyltransferase [Micromonospora foliorum]MCG5439812.1 GNAT family N-acetyltransferase [Micromonospora foliorum]